MIGVDKIRFDDQDVITVKQEFLYAIMLNLAKRVEYFGQMRKTCTVSDRAFMSKQFDFFRGELEAVSEICGVKVRIEDNEDVVFDAYLGPFWRGDYKKGIRPEAEK